MKTIVKNITNIQTGLFAKPIAIGNPVKMGQVVVYLQSKHFDESGRLQMSLYPDLVADGIAEKHLLKPGDVLFAAKGKKNFAAVFEMHNRVAIASTSFFVIRLTDKKVLPEYFAWFLNSPSTQTLLKTQAIGTSIASISKVVLEGLEITVPSIETQKAILQITKLHNKEKSLKREIESLREMQIQQLIINAIK